MQVVMDLVYFLATLFAAVGIMSLGFYSILVVADKVDKYLSADEPKRETIKLELAYEEDGVLIFE